MHRNYNLTLFSLWKKHFEMAKSKSSLAKVQFLFIISIIRRPFPYCTQGEIETGKEWREKMEGVIEKKSRHHISFLQTFFLQQKKEKKWTDVWSKQQFIGNGFEEREKGRIRCEIKQRKRENWGLKAEGWQLRVSFHQICLLLKPFSLPLFMFSIHWQALIISNITSSRWE